MIKFEEEEIVLRAAEGANGKLSLNVSFFDRWQDTLDGKKIPITPLQIGTNKTGFMTVPLKAGTYRFRFVPHWPERVVPYFFLLSLCVCLFLLIWGKQRNL